MWGAIVAATLLRKQAVCKDDEALDFRCVQTQLDLGGPGLASIELDESVNDASKLKFHLGASLGIVAEKVGSAPKHLTRTFRGTFSKRS